MYCIRIPHQFPQFDDELSATPPTPTLERGSPNWTQQALSSRRLSMKDFLRAQANKGEGVEYFDGDKDVIKIPWVHASKKNWKEEDHCKIFTDWARNTGKCTKNVKKCKANFRCALNSLRDVVELPELSKKNGSNGYRVFRIHTERNYLTKKRAPKPRIMAHRKPRNSSVFESPPNSPPDSKYLPSEQVELLFPDVFEDIENIDEVETSSPIPKIPLSVLNLNADDDDYGGCDDDYKHNKSKSHKRQTWIK